MVVAAIEWRFGAHGGKTKLVFETLSILSVVEFDHALGVHVGG